jgi:hypothetical protein
MNNLYSQAGQDQYVLKVLNYKKNGFFLEIGSNHPININNTYILENQYNWSGIMVDYNNTFVDLYKIHRPNSKYIINDATKIDYINYLDNIKAPLNIDYLQIDLEVDNKSTIDCLELLNNTVFDKYNFATITFEHDIYRGNYYNTRSRSREIFENRGYKLVFPDVAHNNNKFEDWYVYPNLVNMSYIDEIKQVNSINYNDILKIL